jgi:hypothetical protein
LLPFAGILRTKDRLRLERVHIGTYWRKGIGLFIQTDASWHGHGRWTRAAAGGHRPDPCEGPLQWIKISLSVRRASDPMDGPELRWRADAAVASTLDSLVEVVEPRRCPASEKVQWAPHVRTDALGAPRTWTRIWHSHPPSAIDGRTQSDATKKRLTLFLQVRRCFWLFRGGGRGWGRTADLPLFRSDNVPVQATFAEVRRWSTGACVGLWQGVLSSTLSSTKPSVREAINVRERSQISRAVPSAGALGPDTALFALTVALAEHHRGRRLRHSPSRTDGPVALWHAFPELSELVSGLGCDQIRSAPRGWPCARPQAVRARTPCPSTRVWLPKEDGSVDARAANRVASQVSGMPSSCLSRL